MKKLSIVVLLVALSCTSFAKAVYGDTIGRVPKKVNDAVNVFGTGVFDSNQEKFLERYSEMTDVFFKQYLKENVHFSLPLGDTLRIFWKVFFRRNGNIRAIVCFAHQPKDLSRENWEQLLLSLAKFKKEFHFPEKGRKSFAQCGTVSYVFP